MSLSPGNAPQDVGGPEAVVPSAEAIGQALERVVASPDFVASDRARRFLRYIVDETLAGRADRIKAFSVAVEVFGRDETFDPQNDPVVRIEAGRLRRALEHFYLLSGRDDPVVIEIPKGRYVPVFLRRQAVAEPEPETPAPALPVAAPPREVASPPARPGRWLALVAVLLVAIAGAALIYATSMAPVTVEADAPVTGPSVVVLPFTDLGEGSVSALYSAALTDDIVSALGGFKEITVLGVQTSRSLGPDPHIGKVGEQLGVEYVLEGSVRADLARVRVAARLLSATNGAVLWSRSYEHPLTAGELFAVQMKTAGEVASAIAQPYGIVFQAEAAAEPSRPPDDLDAYLCTLRYYVYRASISPGGYREVRSCLEGAVARFPEYATAWALLAHVYVDEVRTGFAKSDEPPEAKALAAARTAVRLDPENVRALQALAVALFFSHHLDEAYRVADRALELNPNDSELLGQLGQLMGQSGRTTEGRALLERALELNPGHSGFYRGVLALIAYMQRDYHTALIQIEQADVRKLPVYHGVAAMIYAQNGMIERGRSELETFQEMAPDFLPNLWAELDRRNIPYESQLLIVNGLEKVGAVIPPRRQALN
ncbi:MAG TPA: tetratricopeptide repeat protein [Bauldia sp.]|nr:tetratricopeptide repeat protein [Bauldia sp.]